MRCLVTAGPTYEPLDQVRRLTNFSTGALGVALANDLFDRGHTVTILVGYYSTCRDVCRAQSRVEFTTTESLFHLLRAVASQRWDVIFHAAAVSDFSFGQVFRKNSGGQVEPLTSGKYSTRHGTLFAELIPTPKIIAELPKLFPRTKICGWKYEVDGSRESALELAQSQIAQYGTHFAVANGPAYGEGFGLVGPPGLIRHCPRREDLFEAFAQQLLG